MLKEFKAFIASGNVIEFAVAVIMAGAIGEVVKGFVSMIVMPVVGHFMGGMDFAELKMILTAGVEEVQNAEGVITTEAVAENAIMYGAWINTIVSLIIIGFVMFMMIKGYNKMKKKEEEAPAAPPAPTKEEVLLGEIRDLLKK